MLKKEFNDPIKDKEVIIEEENLFIIVSKIRKRVFLSLTIIFSDNFFLINLFFFFLSSQ